MNIKKLTLTQDGYPAVLQQIPSPPAQLYHTGAPLKELMKRPRVAIVGTRLPSAYGEQVTLNFATGLSEQGVVIISGLAFGIDAIAHKATLEAGGLAIAVLPGPLENIMPVSNRRLAKRILDQGGALVSEYAEDDETYKTNFVARNRIVSGLADAVLIPEASALSGTRHTVSFALEQGKEVLAVPGNIHSPYSAGTNNYIKSGAKLVTELADILQALNLQEHATAAKLIKGRNPQEQAILNLMLQGINDGSTILQQSGLEVSEFNQTLTMLEISGKIRPLGANQWALC